MLQQVLESINNLFVPKSAQLKTYTIQNGNITPAFGAEDGDRFLICMSKRNDGLYTWHDSGITNDDDKQAAGLRDETFAGTIRISSVPPALLTLSEEISQWVESNKDQLSSPLASESFNGYGYTLKSGAKNGGNGPLSWQDIFADQLDAYRRLYR